ncbi:MAG: BamA/TamA family outer membrane protein [Candidatus Krumholzibacteriota bacterium]
MTFVWKLLRGSSRRSSAGTALAVVALVLSPGQALPAATDPVIVFARDRNPTGQEQDWLDQDSSWFGSLPAADKLIHSIPASLDSISGAEMDPEDLKRLREMVAAASAGGDTTSMVRPVASRLRDRWLDRGFLTTEVEVRGDSVVIHPGPVWTIGTLEIGGDDFPGRSHLLATWLPRSGDRFKPEEWNLGIDMVLMGTGEAGYPFPRWVTREVELVPADHSVTVRAMLLPGNPAYLGPVTSDLAEERAAHFLARSSGLQPGAVFRHSDLDRARQRLLARDLYTTVGEPRVYLTSAGDTVGVHIPVVPRRKINRLQVVLGLSRRQDDTGSRLSGEVDLRLPNMAGTGRSLQVGWRDDGNQRSRFGFSYLEPLAFGTPLDMVVALDNEVEEEAYTRFRLENAWRLPVVSLWGIELGAGWDRVTYPTGSLERTSRVRARGAVLHRRGDRTRSGWEGVFAIETAWRSAALRPAPESETTVSSQLGEAVTQRIFEGDAAGELWLGRTLSLAGRASFRQLTGGDLNVPLSEQFRFGGAASLRGYREGEFHGSVAAWGSVEALIGRPGGSRLYTFYDLGYFEFWTLDPLAADPAELLQIRDWPRGYGLGILAVTPAGDISLAVGFPGTVDFDQAKLHVTLLETF